MSGGDQKKCQMTNLTMPTNRSFMKFALNSVSGLADVEVPHGVGGGAVTTAPGPGSKIRPYHVDQHQKLKG